MKTLWHKKTNSLLLLLFTILFLIIPAAYANDNDPLTAVQQQLEAVGTYRFTGDIEQTLIPVANSANIGQSETRIDTHFSGEKTAVDQFTISLRLEGGGVNSPAINLEQDGGKLYLVENGERTKLEDSFGFVGPTADQTAYLHAAENVHLKEDGRPVYIAAVYEFDINGALFADYMRDQAQSQLPPSAQNIHLEASPALQKMTGSGELWVDENGLPRRQILHLTFPEMGGQYDTASTMQMDFHYDAETVLKLSSSNSLFSSFSPRSALPDLPTAVTHTIALFSVFFFLIALLQNRRWVRTAVPVTIAALLIFTPILQTVDLTRYAVQQAKAQSLTEALGLEEENNGNQLSVIGNQSPVSNLQSTTTTDPTTICGDGSTSDDTDNDGLDDFTENCLGTDPYYFDSDRDTITDTLEVAGYTYAGQTWYSNPTDPDSNKDGIPDGLEWAAPDGTAVSHDIDSDGIPNLWDDDNDGDGVPDSQDIAPFSTTGYQPSFELYSSRGNSSFNGYQYIEFQMQPEDASHLRYGTTPLDWPDDEEGNLQDLDGSSEDLYLTPYLEVRSNVRPDDDLLQSYGISYYSAGSGYVLYVPVTSVSDGGKIVAFYGKAAYGPNQVGGLNHTLFDIRWESMKLVWMAQMNADQMEKQPDHHQSHPHQHLHRKQHPPGRAGNHPQ